MSSRFQERRPRGAALALAVAGLLAGAAPASAHHSFAMYDSAKLLTLNCTVKEFQWANPHAVLWVIAGAAPGEPLQNWSIELPTSPGNLTRMGWTKHSLNPGDRIVLEFNPLRDGSKGGSFKKATVASTGTVLVVNLK